MIGWKCKWGYYTSESAPPSSLVVLDQNGWIGFLSKLDLPVDNIDNTHSSARADYVHKGDAGFITSAIDAGAGRDSVLITPVVVNGYHSDLADDNIVGTFPAFKNIAPNTFGLFHGTSNRGKFLGCYIPSLHRYLRWDRSSYGGCYASNDTEGSSWGERGHSYFPFGVMSNSANVIAYIGEVNAIELSKPTNYRSFAALTNEGYYVSSVTWKSDNILSSLFGNNYSPPDYNIPDNPYEPGGPSGPTDPNLPPGTFDDESDTIPDSPLPTLSAANTGFTRIYNPTLSQVQSLARYLWTDPDVIQTIWNHIKQFFENPMEAIIGFNLVPVPVPDGGTENFALMYIDTGVSMTVAANQFVDLDCGTVELKRYYGSALDQSPYTKVSCFLPYIGTVNLNTDEVMGTTLRVKYRVDIVTGACVAKIFVDGNCLYQYSGHCAITIPISSADFSSYVSAAISVGKLAAAAITAGAGAAMAAGVAEVSQQTNQVVTTTQVTNTARNPSTGRQITTGTTTTVQTRESPADQSSTQASFSGLSPQNVANTVGAIMSSKPHIEHSGSFSGNSGYLGVRRPFLIIERPNMCMPANYQALNGFPAMITMELSTCKGFTRVQQVQLTGMGRATNPEQAEIMELLKSGVIL